VAKLTADVLAEGRAMVQAQDLDGLRLWCETHAYTLTWSEVERTLSLCYRAGDCPRAVKVFDRVFSEVDIARDIRQRIFRLGCLLFVAAGITGGVIHLVAFLF
jgi:hypothetical protein